MRAMTAAWLSEKLELLDVKDSKYTNAHHQLLLKIRQNKTVHDVHRRVKRRISEQYEIEATYLAGPLNCATGSRVCKMGGGIDWDGSIRLTNGRVMVDPLELRGLSIGSYLLNRVVTWAKTLEPERRIQQLYLSEVDAVSIGNRTRRNRLYRKFGLRLEFLPDAPEAVGHSAYDMTIAELVNFSDTEWPNLRVSGRMPLMHDLLVDHHKLKTAFAKAERQAAFFRRRSIRYNQVFASTIRCLGVVFNGTIFFSGGCAGFFLGNLVHIELGQSLSRWISQL